MKKLSIITLLLFSINFVFPQKTITGNISDANGPLPGANIIEQGPNPPYPERMPYSNNELNSNENAPADDPSIFAKTRVNQ